MPNCDRHLASSAQLPLLSLRLWGQRHSWLCNSAVRREHHRPTTSNVSMKTEMLERQNAARVTDAPMWKKKVLKASGKRCRVCTSCTNYNNKNNAHTFFFTCPIQGCRSPEWSLLFTGPGWTFQSLRKWSSLGSPSHIRLLVSGVLDVWTNSHLLKNINKA